MQPHSPPGLEDIIMDHAFRESSRIHGGSAPALNPLEQLMEREFDAHDRERDTNAAEILMKLLMFAADGINIPGVKSEWRRIERCIKPGNTIHYTRAEGDEIIWPFVEIKDSEGNLVSRFEPARLKNIRNPRPEKKERNRMAEIKVLVILNESAAIRVGTRVIALAQLAGVAEVRELSGAGVAKKLGVTRQAVSLTNRAMDEKIRNTTGGKTGARGLRHTTDPRKNLTREQIKARK